MGPDKIQLVQQRHRMVQLVKLDVQCKLTWHCASHSICTSKLYVNTITGQETMSRICKSADRKHHRCKTLLGLVQVLATHEAKFREIVTKPVAHGSIA